MSFLRRLFGQASPQPRHVPSHYTFLPPGDGETTVQVVGESNYQGSLRWAASGTTKDGPNNPRVYAEVIPEPTNPHDPNAVKVQVGGRLVGYLARSDAMAYQLALLPHVVGGRVPACEARIKGGYTTADGFQASLGIELYLGLPTELVQASQGPSELPPAGT